MAVDSPVCGGDPVGESLALWSGNKPALNLYLLRLDFGQSRMGRGVAQNSLACDGFALSCCHKVGVAGLVLVPFSSDVNKLSRCNQFPRLCRLVMFPPRLPDLLERIVFQVEVLACVLVPGEVQLTC